MKTPGFEAGAAAITPLGQDVCIGGACSRARHNFGRAGGVTTGVPIEDELLTALREGRVNAAEHILIVHPADLDRLRHSVSTAHYGLHGDTPPYSFIGFQVFQTSLVAEGHISFVARPSTSAYTPPSDPWRDPEAAFSRRSPRSDPLAGFDINRALTSGERALLVNFELPPEPERKTLWEHLEDDDGGDE